MLDITGKKAAILGFGVNNAELPSYLAKHGASVTICDKREDLTKDIEGVTYRLGSSYLDNLEEFDIVFRTPGIPYLTPEIQDAKKAGTVITSQTQFFLEHCQASVIGVTGTKGKGTTSSLIYEILCQAKKHGELTGHVYLAGNIGISPISFLDEAKLGDWVVLELSSFQLEDVTVSPHIAVVLNVTSDHLDYHITESAYVEAKKNIVRYQQKSDYAVLCQDSPTSLSFAEETLATTYFYSRQKSVDQGAFVEKSSDVDVIILRLPNRDDLAICKTNEVKLLGEYNLENITAAITATSLAGVGEESIRSAVTTFTGLPHRLQFVIEKNGIRFFDDSKATTPESTIAAIKSFDEPITLIVGGSSKGADYNELVNAIESSNVTNVVCIGQEGKKLYELLSNTEKNIVMGERTMEGIVAQASSITRQGSVILLSPAAASFDMFSNAEDRGQQFQDAVKRL